MKTNWLTKCCTRYRGHPSEVGMNFYMPPQIGYPTTVYQSDDLPWVFLGSAETSDLEEVRQIAGQPICMRIDLTDQNTEYLPGPVQKIPFPELNIWDDQSYQSIHRQFTTTVNNIVRIITSKRCPIYVHCSMGANRSVSILAAALSQITGKSVFNVLKEMKSKRGLVSPHDAYIMMAVENSGNDFDIKHRENIRERFNLDGSQLS